MKPRSRAVAVAFAAATASLAFAASATTKAITIARAITVGSVTLPPGEYVVQWSGTGRNVIISLSQDSTIVATVPAILQIVQNRVDGVAGVQLLVAVDWSKLRSTAVERLAS